MKKLIPTILVAVLAITGVFAGCSKDTDATNTAKTEKAKAAPVLFAPEEEVYIWPYTGLTSSDPFVMNRRPLSVKIEDSSTVRPQFNFTRADIIYESLVEGGETRFNCIFHSDIPDVVGNVRSARLSDLWIVPQYNPLFMYAGGNREFKAGLRKYIDADMSYNKASVFYRTSDMRAPHNLYLKLSEAYKDAKRLKYATTSDDIKPLTFSSEVSEDQTALYKDASQVTITFAGYSEVIWTWDKEKNAWTREQGGKVHSDRGTEKQVQTDNIAVMVAKYTQSSALDPAGNPTYDVDLGGTGKAMLFRDGKVIECTWEADRNTPPKFIDANGNVVPFKPGKTWFEVPATTTKITVK